MKKRNFMTLLGLAGLGLAAQAQVVATLGFEEGDAQFTNPDSTQFDNFFADHINLYAGDVWNEKCEDAHSGQYALEAANGDAAKGNPWDRGLKLRGLKLEPETSYRVSFYVKASETFPWKAEDGTETNEPTGIKSSLSVGKENLEAPFMSQGGTQYYYNYTEGMTGDWRRISFVSYFSGWDVQNQFFDQFDDNIYEIKVNDPNDVTKNDTVYWKEIYGLEKFPEEFFLTINMYNPGTYYLDDIKIEKATMAGCTYNYDFIKVDLGYPTNIDDLAKASTDPAGIYLLPNSCVKVMAGDQELPIMSVEGKQDGYLYIFIKSEDPSNPFDFSSINADEVRVSFTPPADCPIVYNTDQRPSMDVESEMTVLPFESEAIYLDGSLDEYPYTWAEPKFVSSVPENGSFELDAATLDQIMVTYDREVDLSTASATLKSNGVIVSDLTPDMTLSDDKCSILVPVSGLEDGEYELVLNGVANALSGVATIEDQTVKFAVGKDYDDSKSEVVYQPDFSEAGAGTMPVGWLTTFYEGGNMLVHDYGVYEDGTIWNYDYGGKNPHNHNGGSRVMTGFSGDFTSAIYWGPREGPTGTLTFGEQVKDYILEDGTVDPEMDPAIGLKFSPRKHQITFLMAGWNGNPDFNFTLEDLDGNVIARFDNVVASPDVEGGNGPNGKHVEGSVKMTTDFTVPEEGYYMLKFTSEGAWKEYLMADIQLITKPSDAAYYKQLLGEALDSANVVLANAADAVYDGDTKTALTNEVKTANETHFTSPSVVNGVIDKLYALAGALEARIENIDQYGVAVLDAQNAMANLVGTKYVMADMYVESEALVNEYKDVNPSTLSDEVLVDVTPKLVNAAALIANTKDCVDALAYRTVKAAETARTLGAEPESAIVDGENAVDDNDDLVGLLNYANRQTIYKILGETGTIADELKTTIQSETEVDETTQDYKVLISGVEFTSFIKNPHFYTFMTARDTIDNENTPGWTADGNITVRDGVGTYFADAAHPVVNSMVNAYKNQYSIYQSISGLPVGVYDIHFRTRTAPGKIGVNDETGRPDMFIWVSTTEGDTLYTAFAESDMKWDIGWGGQPTIIKNVKIEENTVLTIGAKESYTSGKNVNESGEDAGPWDTNTYVDDARLFMVAPLEGFDYAKAYADNIDDVKVAEAVSYEYYTVDGMKLERPMKGVNLVKIHRADGTTDVKKVIVK